MAVTAMKPKNAVESLREIVQVLLVPELKALKATMEGIKVEMQLRDEKQTAAINYVAENLRQLSQKLDQTFDIRERLAAMEARLSKN